MGVDPDMTPAGAIRSGSFTSILFSNASRARLFFAVDALGCLRSLRARSALDGVSWVQGGLVEIAVSRWLAACNRIGAVVCSLPGASLLMGAGFRPPVSWIAGA